MSDERKIKIVFIKTKIKNWKNIDIPNTGDFKLFHFGIGIKRKKEKKIESSRAMFPKILPVEEHL